MHRAGGRVARLLEKVAPALAIILAVAVLTGPLASSSGLPSHERGIYHTATIGYYLEAAQLLLSDGWWTGRTCLGFQDLLRFYPPIPVVILAGLLWATGDPGTAAAIAYTLALTVLAVGLLMYARSLGSRLPLALVSPLLVLAVPGYAGAVAVYWEYSRVLGDGLALVALALLVKGLRWGEGKYIVASGGVAGLVVLSSLISAQWMALAYTVTLTLHLAWLYRAGGGAAIPAAVRAAWRGLLAMAAVAGWWVVPALLPWGLGHYMRIQTGLGERLDMLVQGLALEPEPWVPGIGVLVALLGLLSLALERRLDGNLVPLASAAVVLAYGLLAYGQGARLYPVVGLLLALAGVSVRGRWWRVAGLAVALVLAFYGVGYYQVYADGLSMDYSFQGSDEYKVALWLRGVEGYVYLMHGDRFHGNQWVAVHNPSVAQVLSHYMEGCLDGEAMVIDYYMKETLNYGRLHSLLVENNVTVVVVDKGWLELGLNPVELMVEEGLLEPAEINRYLEYSAAFYVKGSQPGAPGVVAQYWTPARVAGLLVSLLALYRLYRLRVRADGGGP